MSRAFASVLARNGGGALQALEAGAQEVLADELTKQVKGGLSAEQAVYLAAR